MKDKLFTQETKVFVPQFGIEKIKLLIKLCSHPISSQDSISIYLEGKSILNFLNRDSYKEKKTSKATTFGQVLSRPDLPRLARDECGWYGGGIATLKTIPNRILIT